MCPESAEVHTTLSNVCTTAAGEVEAALAAQRQADQEEAEWIKTEKRQAAEREEKERLERQSQIEKGQKELEATELTLEEKKQVLLEVQKMSKDVQDVVEAKDVEKDNNVSVSTIDMQSVRHSISYVYYFRH